MLESTICASAAGAMAAVGRWEFAAAYGLVVTANPTSMFVWDQR